MGPRTRLLILAAGLLLAAGPASAYQMPNVLGDIRDVAADLEKGKGVNAKLAAFRKAHGLDKAMQAFKPSVKGGLGFGPQKPGDGIELKLLNLGKRFLARTTLAREKADLEKMGFAVLAMGKIALPYAPARPNPRTGKSAMDWKRHADDQEKAAKDLIDAARKGDADALKRAASAITVACYKCHEDFR